MFHTFFSRFLPTLKSRIFALSIGIMILGSAGTLYSVWFTWDAFQNEAAMPAYTMAQTLSSGLSGESLRQLKALGPSSDDYLRFRKRLVQCQKQFLLPDGAASLLVATGTGNFEVLMSSSNSVPPESTFEPKTWELSAIQDSNETLLPALTVGFSRPDGNFITAFAPLIANNGQVIGFLRLTIPYHPASWFSSPSFYFFFVIGFLVILQLVILANQISSHVLAPLKDFETTMTVVGDGQLSARMKYNRPDELGSAVKAFHGMLEGISGIISRIRDTATHVEAIFKSQFKVSQSVSEGAVTQAKAVSQAYESLTSVHKAVESFESEMRESSEQAESASAAVTQLAASIERVDSMAEDLNHAVTGVAASTEEMAASSKEVTQSIEELSRSTAETASAIQEISSSVEEVRTNTVDSSQIARETFRSAEEGLVSTEETTRGMQQIELAVQDSAKIIRQLGERSDKIGEILTIINDISDQTNLLALNASIIAAQAGEHGRGFAVVAEEIRELAERTGASTREIADLISTVQTESLDAVTSMEVGLDAVAKGVTLSQRSGEMLKKIHSAVKQTDEMIRKISFATESQSQNSNRVTTAMEEVSKRVSSIERAMRGQEEGRQQIIEATQKISQFASHLKSATAEQSLSSRTLNESIVSFAERIQATHQLTHDQTEQSKSLRETMAVIENITTSNLQSADELRETTRNLSEQISALMSSVSEYHIS